MKIDFENIHFNRLTKLQVIDLIHAARMNETGGRLVTPNLHFYSLAIKNPILFEFINSHDVILCDGVPLVWLSKLSENPIPCRIAGSDLIIDLLAYASSQRLSLAFIGGTNVTNRVVLEIIKCDYPGIKQTSFFDGYLQSALAIKDELELLKELKMTQPDIFIVGLGFPKQEEVSQLLSEYFPKAWFINIGMGMKYLSGEMYRCPTLLQRVGLEWMWRLLSEPTRLFQRYIREDIPTCFLLFTRLIVQRRGL